MIFNSQIDTLTMITPLISQNVENSFHLFIQQGDYQRDIHLEFDNSTTVVTDIHLSTAAI